MHFDEEMGLQYLDPGITVLSPSDPRLPQYVSIRSSFWQTVAAALDWAAFAPSNEDLAFRAGVCHLMNLFLGTMFKLR